MTKKERELVYKLLRMLADKLGDVMVEEIEDIEKIEHPRPLPKKVIKTCSDRALIDFESVQYKKEGKE